MAQADPRAVATCQPEVQKERDGPMTLTVGFTGTQKGMTANQKFTVYTILQSYAALDHGTMVFRHGDCIGADAEADKFAHALGYYVITHPPVNESKRACCPDAWYEEPAKEYLERNKDIVHAASVMIATPGEREEVLRSGTWSTVRYAKKNWTTVLIVYPEGDVFLQEFTKRE